MAHSKHEELLFCGIGEVAEMVINQSETSEAVQIRHRACPFGKFGCELTCREARRMRF